MGCDSVEDGVGMVHVDAAAADEAYMVLVLADVELYCVELYCGELYCVGLYWFGALLAVVDGRARGMRDFMLITDLRDMTFLAGGLGLGPGLWSGGAELWGLNSE